MLLSLLFNALPLVSAAAAVSPRGSTCVVKASGTNKTDDAPAIRSAFEECGRGGSIVFSPNTTYYVNSVLNISGLEDVDIDIQGKLLWSTNISYWLNASLDVGYQNQSTAFKISGNNVRIQGHGVGELNGNGDYWYQWIRLQANRSNYPGRPHQITFDGLTNSVVKGLNFIRSQMWTMSIIHTHNTNFEDIFINNTGNVVSSSNTDGADTIYSSSLYLRNWTVYNGDDSISFKANSTNITLVDSYLANGLGIAIGSIGQLYREFETVEDIYASNIKFNNTLHAFYVKTWTDDRNGYPPNGGGGGLGYTQNLRLENSTATGLRGAAFSISQCTAFSGAPDSPNCTNSQFEVGDITIEGLTGTSASGTVASLQCSAVAPCANITLEGIDLTDSSGDARTSYLCGNVVDNIGFNCTGSACVGSSATGEC